MDHSDDDDFDFNEELSDKEHEELSAMFEKERREAENHPLYRQLDEIEQTLVTLLDNSKKMGDMAESHGNTLRESMMMVRVKLLSALQSKNYLISMQNASLIREHAEYLRISSHMLKYSGFDKTYVTVFREEMETFRGLFKVWASEIKEIDKDGIEDEWGLF